MRGVFLDDLPELSFHAGFGSLGKRGAAGHGDEEFVLVKQQRYSHALAVHPYADGSARIVYNLDGKFKTFTAEAAICESKPYQVGNQIDGVTFQVYGDGKLIAEPKLISVRGSRRQITADVTNVKTLTLRAFCGKAAGQAWAAWLNPAVTR